MSDASNWLDATFDWLYSSQPVSATFVGRRGYDGQWPNLSAAGIRASAERAIELHASAPFTSADRWEMLDVELLRRHLAVHTVDAAALRVLEHPTLITGEAVFGIVSLLLRDERDADARAGHVAERLRGLPQMLAQGCADLRSASQTERERAQRELNALETLLTNGVSLPLALQGAPTTTLANVSAAAAAAVANISDARTRIAALPETSAGAVDPQHFLERLRNDHLLETDAGSLLNWVADERARAQTEFNAALEAGGHVWIDDLLATLRADTVDAAEYDSTFADVWQRTAQQAVDARIVDWPAWPIVFRPTPRWAQVIAPQLYFLLYRCPPQEARQVLQEYLYPPLGAAPEVTLAAVNRSQISLNHVIHHAGLGHHVQNWHAFRAPSRVGRVAGTDVATRILLPCAGTLVEGWACRAPELIAEYGFLADLERLALLHTRLRLTSRAMLDLRVNMQTDDMGWMEYLATTGASESAAQDEALRVALHPGSGVMYLLGQRALERMAADRGLHKAPPGTDLRAFHREVLAHGAVPVSAIAQMMQGADAIRDLTLDELVLQHA